MNRSRPKGGGLDSLGTSWGCAMGLPLSIPGGQGKKISFFLEALKKYWYTKTELTVI